MDFRRQLGIARKWIALVVACSVIGAAVAFALSMAQKPVYEARATLIVGQSLQALNPDFNQLMVSQRLSSMYAEIATNRPALERVISELDLTQTPEQLATLVWAEARSDSTLMTITAQAADPEQAAGIANAVADQLIADSPAIQGQQSEFQKSIEADLLATQEQIVATQRRVDRLASLASPEPEDAATLETLQGRLVSLRATYASLLSYSASSATNLITVIEPAIEPEAPVSPRVLLNTLLGGLVGMLVALAIAAVVEFLDDRVKDPDSVQETIGLSTLGNVARMKTEEGRAEFYQLATLLHPRSGVAESYRTLRSNIDFASVDHHTRTLLVTSSAPNEGKTITASNLAVAFAQTGLSTILVDADLRKPGVHSVFRLVNGDGLTTLLRSDTATVDAVAHGTEQASLRIVTTGPIPPNPAEMLGSQRMRAVVEQLKAAADLVIFDSPPVRAVTDAVVMSSYLDATVLVVNAEATRRDALRQARAALALADANVIGVVLNRVAEATSASGYGYHYDDLLAPVGDRPPAPEDVPAAGAPAPPTPVAVAAPAAAPTVPATLARSAATGKRPQGAGEPLQVSAARYRRLGLEDEPPDGRAPEKS